ncbi:LacI family transcriptional regulator [Pararhizobium capsulatum DSM 1112]|uniref:LacI family transcriptional regulator n=1 Tax=Pararhizobium capsulatum DSM 1112 TaxID=1121113 RepID=A0ABU0BV05_9HYPH|nr:LacI family DNA-binding transcriptional regulator [Pararhizobium capsulatum]MDQ0321516.1 LacI family transcriptional regulator [Pararhizobium capsulatum DSM 1112]
MSQRDEIAITRERVTIRTVAAHAGVSVAAVSKVLRNAYGVSEALRSRVQTSIGTLGYRPSRTARGLRGSTFTIGLLLVDIRNPFLPEVIDGVNGVLAPSHYSAMIGVGEAKAQLETSLIESMIDYKMDGLILVAPRLPSEIISRFAEQIPIVAVGYHDPTAVNFDTVNCDDQQGATLAVEAFIERGYCRISMLTLGSREGHRVSVVRQREIGYRQTMEAAGLAAEIDIHSIPVASPEREESMRAFLSRPDRPEAVFCWSDIDAVTFLNVAAEMGIRVPEDLAVIGYDNSPTAALSLINLASIDQSGRALGVLATETLLSRIEGREAPLALANAPSFIARRSLGRTKTS